MGGIGIMFTEKEDWGHEIKADLDLRNRNWENIDNLQDEVTTLKTDKVDKITGKSLSANDYTDGEKLKNQENADNVSSLQGVRIHEGTTKPTDTRFWYDPNDNSGVIRK